MKKGPNPRFFLILAFISLLVGGGLVYTGLSSVSNEEEKVAALRTQVKDEKTIQAQVEDSAKKLSDASTQLSHLEQGIPDAAYVPTMLAELEKTGQASGMAITGVRPMPKVQPVKKDDSSGQAQQAQRKAYDEQSIEVKGTGNYDSVMKFVQALNSFPKIVATRTLTIVPKSDSSKDAPKDILDVTIELKTYMFSTPAAQPGAGAVKNG